VLVPGTSSAASLCTELTLRLAGFDRVDYFAPYRDGDVTSATDNSLLEYWMNGRGERVIRGANLRADGKTGLIVKGGTAAGANNLGQSGSIGSAPTGGWCSDRTTNATIWGYLGYWAGGTWWRTGNIAFPT
jgi:hypothetical protein